MMYCYNFKAHSSSSSSVAPLSKKDKRLPTCPPPSSPILRYYSPYTVIYCRIATYSTTFHTHTRLRPARQTQHSSLATGTTAKVSLNFVPGHQLCLGLIGRFPFWPNHTKINHIV